MSRMVALGPEQFTLPLGAVGFEPVAAGQADFLDALRSVLAEPDVALVACGESLLTDEVTAGFRELCESAETAVLVVPDGPEARGTAYELTRRMIEQAAGVDLLSSVEENEAGKKKAESEN